MLITVTITLCTLLLNIKIHIFLVFLCVIHNFRLYYYYCCLIYYLKLFRLLITNNTNSILLNFIFN